MLSMRRVLVVLLSVASVSLWALQIEAGTAYFYATTSASGWVECTHADSWDEARQAPTGTGYSSPYETGVWWEGRTNPDRWGIRRGFLSFDTSTLPEDAEVTSAELRLYCSFVYSASFSDSVFVCGGLQGSSLSADDYIHFIGWHRGSGAYDGPIVGRLAWDDCDGSDYITISVSSAAFGMIEAGDPQGALINDLDFDDNEPASDEDYELLIFYAAYPDTSKAARLKVVYDTD